MADDSAARNGSQTSVARRRVFGLHRPSTAMRVPPLEWVDTGTPGSGLPSLYRHGCLGCRQDGDSCSHETVFSVRCWRLGTSSRDGTERLRCLQWPFTTADDSIAALKASRARAVPAWSNGVMRLGPHSHDAHDDPRVTPRPRTPNADSIATHPPVTSSPVAPAAQSTSDDGDSGSMFALQPRPRKRQRVTGPGTADHARASASHPPPPEPAPLVHAPASASDPPPPERAPLPYLWSLTSRTEEDQVMLLDLLERRMASTRDSPKEQLAFEHKRFIDSNAAADLDLPTMSMLFEEYKRRGQRIQAKTERDENTVAWRSLVTTLSRPRA